MHDINIQSLLRLFLKRPDLALGRYAILCANFSILEHRTFSLSLRL